MNRLAFLAACACVLMMPVVGVLAAGLFRQPAHVEWTSAPGPITHQSLRIEGAGAPVYVRLPPDTVEAALPAGVTRGDEVAVRVCGWQPGAGIPDCTESAHRVVPLRGDLTGDGTVGGADWVAFSFWEHGAGTFIALAGQWGDAGWALEAE